mgnify:CR=1 FL=1
MSSATPSSKPFSRPEPDKLYSADSSPRNEDPFGGTSLIHNTFSVLVSIAQSLTMRHVDGYSDNVEVPAELLPRHGKDVGIGENEDVSIGGDTPSHQDLSPWSSPLRSEFNPEKYRKRLHSTGAEISRKKKEHPADNSGSSSMERCAEAGMEAKLRAHSEGQQSCESSSTAAAEMVCLSASKSHEGKNKRIDTFLSGSRHSSTEREERGEEDHARTEGLSEPKAVPSNKDSRALLLSELSMMLRQAATPPVFSEGEDISVPSYSPPSQSLTPHMSTSSSASVSTSDMSISSALHASFSTSAASSTSKLNSNTQSPSGDKFDRAAYLEASLLRAAGTMIFLDLCLCMYIYLSIYPSTLFTKFHFSNCVMSMF